MLTHNDLKKGARFILDGQPYEVLESQPLKVAQGRAIIQTKLRNLVSGSVFVKNFHQGDTFEEAELEKTEAKFVYQHKGKFIFSESKNPANRFELTEEQIGSGAKFLKPNEILTAIKFQDKIVNVILPIKVQLKVVDAPPGFRGGRAQAGTKTVTLESGGQVNVPLFIEQDDIIEVNTETGEYVRRVE